MSPLDPPALPSPWTRTWSRFRTLAGVLALAGTFWACALLGFWHAFSRFNEWDDEGYFLLALRSFREHGGLYDDIRNVFYGPLYFELTSWGSALLHIPLDHSSARWLMLSSWGAGLAACGFVAWRLRANLLGVALVIAAGLQYLLLVCNEPLHATMLELILLAPLLFLCFRHGSERAPGTRTMFACGVLCAAIALVKLNVGLLVALAFLCAHPPAGTGRAASIARWSLAVALVVFPFALMRQLLEIDWVQDYALLVSAALLPFACRVPSTPALPVERKALFACVAGAALLTILSIGACLVHGTSVTGLWRALVLDALDFPLTTHNSPPLPDRIRILWCLLVLPIGWALRARPLARNLLQLAAGLWALFDCLRLEIPFGWLQFLWLFTLSEARSPRRFFLGALAVLLSLQAYPQAGAQLGAFSMVVPLVALCGICAAWQALEWPARAARLVRTILPTLSGIAALWILAALGPLWNSWSIWRDRWKGMQPLDLPGCAGLRMPELEGAQHAWLAANLAHNADAFVGLPGVPSEHIWSGVPAPVPFYSHHWVLYYDAAQEAQLTQALLASKRPCIVRNGAMLPFWTAAADYRDGPFSRALHERFTLAGLAGHYELWLPRTSRPELVLSVFSITQDRQLVEHYGRRRTLRLRFPIDGGYLVKHIAVRNVGFGLDLFDTSSVTEKRRITALTPEGAQILAGPSAQPLDPRQTPEVLLLLPRIKLASDSTMLLIRAYGPDGEVVARLLPQIVR